MCIFPSPKVDDPTAPPEYAQSRKPDPAVINGAGDRAANKLRAAAPTVLTSGSGVTMAAPTEKKTLLGQ